MRVDRKCKTVAMAILLMLLMLPNIAMGQQPKSLVANAAGEGTIKIGKEEFKIHAIVVKLFEDGNAEIHVLTDITVLITGTWDRGDDAERSIILKITGGATTGGIQGNGKLFLTEDRKSIASMKLDVLNRLSKKIIKANFVAK